MQGMSQAHHNHLHPLQAQLAADLASRGLPTDGAREDLMRRLFVDIGTKQASKEITDLPAEVAVALPA